MMEDNARLQDELELYQNYGNFAVDNLFWCLTFMNSVLFQAPNANDIKEKLLAQKRAYEGLITAYYPGPEGQRLVNLVDENNRLFIIYTQRCHHKDPAAVESARRKWTENGAQIARHLAQINPHWKQPEWSAMISHEAQLITSIARATCQGQYEAFVNTVPLCKNVAIDMAAYMASGIAKRFLA